MSRGDRRQRVLVTALNSPDLSVREKLFMVVVGTVAAEYVDGKRRHGSKAMGPDGKFAFHLDYLAKALGTTTENVKQIRRGCQRRGHLAPVHEGTFGRPSTWQGQVVRGDAAYGVTFRPIVTPYVSEDPSVRGNAPSPLVYRTPDERDHAPEPGGLKPAPSGTATALEWLDATTRPETCAWCRARPCVPGCPEVDSPDNRRRTA